MSEHGRCPHCDADLNGGSIWQHFFNEFTVGAGDWLDANGKYIEVRRMLSDEDAEKRADEVAANYGATRTSGQWGRQIGIEKDRDRIEYWMCPDCKKTWNR